MKEEKVLIAIEADTANTGDGSSTATLGDWIDDAVGGEFRAARLVTQFNAPVVGTVVALRDGNPIVSFPASVAGALLPARSTVSVRETDVGREVVLAFDQGDPHRPIILGLLQHGGSKERRVVELDGEDLVLSADRELVLRCGQASITLTRAGKIVIRGAYLSSRSSGLNRIKGAAVQIN